MRLILLTFAVAIVIGLLAGGRLRGLSGVRFRWPYLALLGIVLQFFPVGGWVENALVLLSFAALCVFALANIRQPGFVLVFVGLALNLVVIGVNQGMPVSHRALLESGQEDLIDDLVHSGGAKHHLATDDDSLRFLGDVIAIPPPVSQAASIGDLLMYAGAGWFIVAWMRRRGGRQSDGFEGRDDEAPGPERDPTAPGPRGDESEVPFAALALRIAVIILTIGWLAAVLPGSTDQVFDAAVVFFIVAIAIVDLIPVPVWGGMQLSLSFPILLGVAVIFDPPLAALIALLGSADPREVRAEVSPSMALFNRCQVAISILLASGIFHGTASQDSPWYVLIPSVLVAALVAYAVNVLAVAAEHSLKNQVSLRRVMGKMHGSAPYEFILSYIGLGLFGAAIARFYITDGLWAVMVFLAPLIFARQMYFRSRALADQLAERNTLLAEQAQRLEGLLHKEHETVDELRELNRMKGEFVAVVSHELRTPVTALIGYAKTLQQSEFADDVVLRAEFLDRMERQGDRLLRLVENLLTASRLESRQLPVTSGRLLFEDVCREVVESLAGEADRIDLRLPPDLPVMHSDRQLLGRVIQNLIDNALKYSPEGAACELGARVEGDNLVFWVTDQGIGIPTEQVDRIFDRFYQVDSSSTRNYRGAGLGLSLVADLMDHLGGSIAVDSVEGIGSTFTVTLPVNLQVEEEDEAGRPAHEESDPRVGPRV
jgi:signal transduction histidine kinase